MGIVAALCGMLGYRDLFQSDWLKSILSWQRNPPGCWPVDDNFVSLQQSAGKSNRRMSL